MKYIVYMDDSELMVTTPEGEAALIEKLFVEQGTFRRSREEHKRVELDGDYLIGFVHENMLKLECSSSRRVHRAPRTLGMPVHMPVQDPVQHPYRLATVCLIAGFVIASIFRICG